MFRNRARFLQGILILVCLGLVLGLKTEPANIGLVNALKTFREGSAAFAGSSLELKRSIALLDPQKPQTLTNARLALKKSRLSYKRIAFFLNYFFESSALIYNKPAKVEVEEPYMEYQEPSGFQVMEADLYDTDPASHRQNLAEQAALIASSAADLDAMLYDFTATDAQLLESAQLELIRVITLSITGYDAPELKSGIEESYQSVNAVYQLLEPFLTAPTAQAVRLSKGLTQTLKYLRAHPDFDTFNRMEFLRVYALPLQEDLRDFIHAAQLDLNTKTVLNAQAKNIFSPDALSGAALPGVKTSSKVVVALGKKLFTETALSGNLKRSCASCHQASLYFSDGLKTSKAFDGLHNVQRNAPTLLYAGFQYAQFWDGRAKSLQQQIKAVISNPLEMNGDHQVIVSSLKALKSYREDFIHAFPAEGADPLTIENLSDALAAYIGTLAPRNSAFDRYLAGDSLAMNRQQVKGFNLFMGKGQCGSCHFAPLFNGLIPPLYKLTEYEILGTPANDDFKHLKQDKDQGRYAYFPISYYQASFKTPTVRNVAMTAPYMHNGAFKDLEKVVEFYNQGGGAGLHLDEPGQTLSAKPLHLSKREVRQIVVFMQSLTDKIE